MCAVSGPVPTRPRNDLGHYDDLADQWWDPQGAFALLHWIAAARARLVPSPTRADAVLVDVGCGGGLLAPHLEGRGYTHVGVDLTRSALVLAGQHGVSVARGDAARLPLSDACADVVCAGELLEHVPDPGVVVDEACRVLRPGGTLVLDTVAATALARLLVVTVAERIPGGAPPGLHDPDLFVDRSALVARAAQGGVRLRLRGLRPSLPATLAWLGKRRSAGRMVPTWSSVVLFQAWGEKDRW